MVLLVGLHWYCQSYCHGNGEERGHPIRGSNQEDLAQGAIFVNKKFETDYNQVLSPTEKSCKALNETNFHEYLLKLNHRINTSFVI